MESSTLQGRPMSLDMFDRALDCTERLESLARSIGYRHVLLSGGECTDHPDFETIVEKVLSRGLFPIVLSHGMWLSDDARRVSILRPEWKEVSFQITYDPRFYPDGPPHHVDDPRLVYIPSLSVMLPLGRFKGQVHSEVPTRNSPSSFNFRSLTHSVKDVRVAVAHLRLRALQGLSGHCSPSISANGDVVAGESNACFRIGTVDSSPEEITQAVLAMGSCNRCGLESSLSMEHRRAIGATKLYGPSEGGL